jgi:DNA-binding NarL/FixJ family response regulator
VVRCGQRNLLKREDSITADGEAAVALGGRLRPDVVLMDYSLPGISGVEAVRIILARLPETAIIGLSMFEKQERAAALKDAGASAYLSKSRPPAWIIKTIRPACRPDQPSVS